MNEILQLKDLPWHAWQRRLAEAFGAAGPKPAALGTRPLPRFVADDGSSWLARAHRAMGLQNLEAGR